MIWRAILLAASVLVAAGPVHAADPVTATSGHPALIPLPPPPPSGGRVVIDVTMLAAAGPPASAGLTLRGAGAGSRPLGQLAPYPASFDSKAGDPAQQSQFDVTELLRAHPDERQWTLQIDVQPLAPAPTAAPSRQTFTASFAPGAR